MHEPTVPLSNLAPPPGGLERLRRRIGAGGRRRRREWAGLAAAACGLTMLALALLPGWRQRERSHGDLARVVRQAVQPVELGRLRIIDGAALALESGQPEVRLYLVQSTTAMPVAAPR